jgi:hypothetical protein
MAKTGYGHGAYGHGPYGHGPTHDVSSVHRSEVEALQRRLILPPIPKDIPLSVQQYLVALGEAIRDFVGVDLYAQGDVHVGSTIYAPDASGKMVELYVDGGIGN